LVARKRLINSTRAKFLPYLPPSWPHAGPTHAQRVPVAAMAPVSAPTCCHTQFIGKSGWRYAAMVSPITTSTRSGCSAFTSCAMATVRPVSLRTTGRVPMRSAPPQVPALDTIQS
jgi:hypothetical protein